MGIIDKKDVQDAYKKEAGSLIKKIGKELNRPNNDSRIFRLFRYAHTLKGISGTCGCYKIEEAVKPIAEIFRAAKDDKLKISPEDKVLIKKNLNVCERLLKRG
jgi:chemotaxis protein histidine kinase CheA